MQQAANSAALTAFSTVGGSQKPRSGSKPGQPVNDFTTLYSESMSSPRRVLSRKNSDQPRGNNTMIGRLTSNQAPTAAAAVLPTSRRRPARIANSVSGISSSSG